MHRVIQLLCLTEFSFSSSFQQFSVVSTMDAVALGTGAFCGALCRYQIGRLAGEKIAHNPTVLGTWTGWHTAGINIFGSFVLGGVSQAPAPPAIGGLSPRSKLMLGVGFCGSFTTFSTYSVDVVQWILKGHAATALKYVVVNNVGSIGAAAAGMALVKKMLTP
jgi:fluoride exporter